MKFFPVVVFSFFMIMAGAQSASACEAISGDVAQLGDTLNQMGYCYSADAGMAIAHDVCSLLGDVVVCAAKAAVSNDPSKKASYLTAMKKIEAVLNQPDAETPPLILSALEQIEAALLK